MTECHSHLVPRVLSNFCKRGSEWIYNAFPVPNDKHHVEYGETMQALLVLFLSLANQYDNQQHIGDQLDSSSLGHQILLALLKKYCTTLERSFSFLVSQILPSFFKNESKYGEGISPKKSLKLPDVVREEILQTLRDLSFTQATQSGKRQDTGDQSNSGSPFEQIVLSAKILAGCSRSDYGSIASVNRTFRSLIQNGLVYKVRREEEISEPWIYVCSYCRWKAFNPICHRWMDVPGSSISSNKALAVGTQLLVFGFENQSSMISRYSLPTNSWSLETGMNEPRLSFGCASLGEKAIVAGGCDLADNILSSAECYNSETGTWEKLSRSMNKPRKDCSVVSMDGKFYVIGGSGEGNNVLTCGEVYDPKTEGPWLEILNLLPVRHVPDGQTEEPPLFAVVRNELYAALPKWSMVYKYDQLRNKWDHWGWLPRLQGVWRTPELAFMACGDRLIFFPCPLELRPGAYDGCPTLTSISHSSINLEVYAWEPDADGNYADWRLLTNVTVGWGFNIAAVMSC